MKEIAVFADLCGDVLTSVQRSEGDVPDEIVFTLADGRQFKLFHYQDCCEQVSIEDIAGDLADLVGTVVTAEEASNRDEPPTEDSDYSYTWTFYRIGTAKGTVIIRWFGSSNGYYSESVDFAQVPA